MEAQKSTMPTPVAISFRPLRRSHPGRPGRRGNRDRARVNFARRCSPSREAVRGVAREAAREVALSSALPISGPVSAASRSRERRARAASARACALATSSSASVSKMGVTAPSAGSSEWSALGPSRSCTENEPITAGLGSTHLSGSCLRGSTCGNACSTGHLAGAVRTQCAVAGLLAQVIFSN